MRNIIDIDSYVNGFRIEELSCSDRAIAAAAGGFYKPNYYSFGLLCAMQFNWTNNDFWGHNDKIRWLNRYNNILSPFALEILPHDVCDSKNILDIINLLVEKSYPVIMLMPYYAIPWDERYNDKSQRRATHIFLITECNAERHSLVIRDDFMVFQHNEKSIMQLNPSFNHSLLWRHQISWEQLIHIWEYSNHTAMEEGMYYENTFFSMRKSETQRKIINNYSDLLKYVKSQDYNISYSRMAQLIYNFDNEEELKYALKTKEAKFGVFRRNYVGSIHTIRKVMDKVFLECSSSQLQINYFNEVVNNIIEYRSIVLYKLQKKIWKNQNMSVDEAFTTVQNINSLDDKLIQFIKDMKV